MKRESRLVFGLNLSKEEYLNYYQGAVKFVIARCLDGRTVRFPAGLLRQFVGRNGVRGVFEIVYDKNHKLKQMRRLG